MDLFTPDFGLLFWMTLCFGVVFCVLAKFGFPVIIGAINDRQAHIDASLHAARQANEQLAGIQAQSEELLQQAQTERQSILTDAYQMKQQILEEARQEAQQQNKKLFEEARAQIEEQQQQAQRELRQQTVEMALNLATQVVGNELKDDAAQRASVERMMDELKS